ncbi:MAG TPA: transposase [Herpetosiphonaceae bacterium]
MGLEHQRHFQTYHRVLNRTTWSSRKAAEQLLSLLIHCFASDGVVVLGIDETIERRQGDKIAAKGIYRDAARSSKRFFVKTSGLRWISLMLLAHEQANHDTLVVRQAAWYTKAYPTFADALASVRRPVWMTMSSYISATGGDIQKLQHHVLEQLTETLCYTA